MTDLAFLALLLLAARRKSPHVVCWGFGSWCCLRFGLWFSRRFGFWLWFWQRLRLSNLALLALLLLACSGETAPFVVHRISSWRISWSFSSSGGGSGFLFFLLLFLFFFCVLPGEMLVMRGRQKSATLLKPQARLAKNSQLTKR